MIYNKFIKHFGGIFVADLKNRTRIGNTVDNELLKKFKELSESSRIPMSKLLDEAIIDLIKKYEKVTD